MALVPAFDAVQDQDQVLSVQNKEIPRHIQDSLIRGTTAHITPSNYFPSASRAKDYGSRTLQQLRNELKKRHAVGLHVSLRIATIHRFLRPASRGNM